MKYGVQSTPLNTHLEHGLFLSHVFLALWHGRQDNFNTRPSERHSSVNPKLTHTEQGRTPKSHLLRCLIHCGHARLSHRMNPSPKSVIVSPRLFADETSVGYVVDNDSCG